MTNQQFEFDMKRIAMLKADIKASQQEIEDIFSAHAAILSETGDVVAGDYIVKVTPTVRFDAATAKKNLTEEEYAKTLTTAPNSAQAKKVLSPERYAQAQKTYGWTRNVVAVTDAE